MADVTLTYKGSDILELSNSGSATLKTGGKYCEDDIAVEYVKPSGGGGEDFLAERAMGTLTSYSNHDLTKIEKGTFHYSNILSIDCPSVTNIGLYGISEMNNIESFFFPLASVNSYCARNCTKLKRAVIKTFLAASASFSGCPKLETVDANDGLTGTITFQGDTLLNTLVFRGSSIIGLAHVNAFNNTPFASGGTGGTIYIPKALYDHLGDGTALDYKAATNWSTIDGYGTITWAKIEGSYYETHYADGTEITA